MTGDRVVSGLVLPLWEEVLWPFLDAWDSVRLRKASTQWNVPGRYGPSGELLFLFLKKEPMVLRELVRFGPIEVKEDRHQNITSSVAFEEGNRRTLGK